MNAGMLRHKITIQGVATQATAENSIIEDTSAASTTRRCYIEALTGRELYYAKEVHGEVTHKVLMRFNALNPDDRFTWTDPFASQTRTMNVLWVDTMPQHNGRWVVAYCKELIAA